MGTWYTFTTELISDNAKADELERELKEETKRNPTHFGYTKVDLKNTCYFVGHNKNLGGGFYEWPGVMLDIKMVWVSDEGDKGEWNFDE